MNKSELVEAVSKRIKAQVSQGAIREVIDAALESVGKALKKGDTVRLIGFGTFSVRKRGAHKGRNPHTGESIRVRASKRPVFHAGAGLRGAIK